MCQFLDLPGQWIDGDDRNVASDIHLYFDSAVDAFNEAVVAQRSFETYIEQFLRAESTVELQAASRTDRYRRLIFSKAFVFALDELRQFIGVIAGTPSIPEEAILLCNRFADDYAVVRRVRNSLHHPEERIQGIGPGKKPIDSILRALAVTNERRFGALTERCIVEYVPITHDYLEGVRECLLNLIWAFPWLGVGNQRLERNTNGHTA